MPIIYPPLTIGARRRLDLFKREAAQTKWARPMTWRDVRFATLKSQAGLSQGFNGEGRARVPVWHSADEGPYFRNERDAHGITHSNHRGWYTDADEYGGDELAIGIVASLPHGRFLAGYRLTMNDERVYFPEIHDTEEDAARMADEHARIIAEQESEYQARAREANKLDSLIEEKKKDVCECKARLELAIAACTGTMRDSVTWSRAMMERKRAREAARDIVTDIRAFMMERATMGEF
jgi:hypothetical protein